MNVRIGKEYLPAILKEIARNMISNSVCKVACNFNSPSSLNMKCSKGRSKEIVYGFQNDCEFAA
jgi:hypothetical protein